MKKLITNLYFWVKEYMKQLITNLYFRGCGVHEAAQYLYFGVVEYMKQLNIFISGLWST